MKCDGCGGEIPEDQRVGLNGRNFHAAPCFADGLRKHAFTPAQLAKMAIELAPTMPPMVAYNAGQTFVDTVGPRTARRHRRGGR